MNSYTYNNSSLFRSLTGRSELLGLPNNDPQATHSQRNRLSAFGIILWNAINIQTLPNSSVTQQQSHQNPQNGNHKPAALIPNAPPVPHPRLPTKQSLYPTRHRNLPT